VRQTTAKCRTIAQAISRRFPTGAARVRARVRSCGICGGKCGTGASFLQVLQFTLPIFIPTTASQSPSSGAGRSTKWTQSHPTKINKKIIYGSQRERSGGVVERGNRWICSAGSPCHTFGKDTAD
jgi:hypothetical protein